MSLFRFNWPLLWVTIRSFFNREEQKALPAPSEFSAFSAKNIVKDYNERIELEQTRLVAEGMKTIERLVKEEAFKKGNNCYHFSAWQINEDCENERLIRRVLYILKNRLELKGFEVVLQEHPAARHDSLIIKW